MRNLWTEEETQFILENYPSRGRNYCAELLNKSVGSVASKARRLGLLSSVTRANKVAQEYVTWLQKNKPKIICLEEYTLSSRKTLHKHLSCGHEWTITPNNLKRSTGSGCPNCASNKKYSHQDYVDKISSTEFIVLEDYSGSEVKIKHRHVVCGLEWQVRPHDIIRGQGCPGCAKKPYSKLSIQWLESFDDPRILHGANGGESYVMGYKVDGFNPVEGIVYEFHGDCFHGNLDIYHEDDFCHPYNKTVTAGQLWDKTYEKMFKLATKYEVVFIWERDYKNGKAFELIN